MSTFTRFSTSSSCLPEARPITSACCPHDKTATAWRMVLEGKRRVSPILLVMGLALAAVLVAWGARVWIETPQSLDHSGPQRVVSLSPAMTETLFAIGAGAQVVGVSDYCSYPEEVVGLPRTGSSITPNFENLVNLRPTLIVTENTGGARLDQLRALSNTRALPWLSVTDVAKSTRELGRLTGHERAADELATRIEKRLARRPAPDAPRVLLILGYTGAAEQLWFIKRNCIHGAALSAAGARNAIDQDITGPPTISLERLLVVNPDIVLTLEGPSGDRSSLRAIRQLDELSAVKKGRVGAVRDPAAFIPGPRILHLVDALEKRIAELGATP